MLWLVVAMLHMVYSSQDKVQGSAFFRHINTIHVTQQSWVITFQLHMKPYFDWCDELKGLVQQLVDQVMNIAPSEVLLLPQLRNESTTKLYKTMDQAVRKEIDSIGHSLKLAERYLGTLLPLYNTTRKLESRRVKRSFLPFIGDVLGTLFGTATQSQVSGVKEYLEKLSNSDDEIRHVLDKSITVINHTSFELSTTIRTLNQLIDVNEDIQNDIDELRYFKRFVYEFLQLKENSKIVSDSVNELLFELGSLRDKITHAVQGRVTPHLLAPKRLRLVIQQIHDLLEPNLQLPFPQHEPLDRYYKLLKCSVIPSEDGFLFMTHIPLKDTVARFEIYEIQTIPIPFPNTSIVTKYDLEEKYFAISIDRTKVAFLEEFQLRMCMHDSLNFCPISSPVYTTASLKDNCAMSLFLNRGNINEVCQALVSVSDLPSPAAFKVSHGTWIVTTHVPVQFTKICSEINSERIRIEPPMGVVKLEMGCRASSDHMNLPTEYEHKSSLGELPVEIDIPDLMVIWDPVHEIMNDSAKRIPNKLNEIVADAATLNDLHDALSKHVDNLGLLGVFSHSHTLGLTIGIAVLLLIIGILCYCLCYQRYQSVLNRVANSIVRPPTDHMHEPEHRVKNDESIQVDEPVILEPVHVDDEPVYDVISNTRSTTITDSKQPRTDDSSRLKRSATTPLKPELPLKSPKLRAGFRPGM